MTKKLANESANRENVSKECELKKKELEEANKKSEESKKKHEEEVKAFKNDKVTLEGKQGITWLIGLNKELKDGLDALNKNLANESANKERVTKDLDQKKKELEEANKKQEESNKKHEEEVKGFKNDKVKLEGKQITTWLIGLSKELNDSLDALTKKLANEIANKERVTKELDQKNKELGETNKKSEDSKRKAEEDIKGLKNDKANLNQDKENLQSMYTMFMQRGNQYTYTSGKRPQ